VEKVETGFIGAHGESPVQISKLKRWTCFIRSKINKWKNKTKQNQASRVLVALAYNLSSLENRDQLDYGSKPA
jgi:hypothetical protein